MKKCPFCAEEIQDEAIICRFCGRELAPHKVAQVSEALTGGEVGVFKSDAKDHEHDDYDDGLDHTPFNRLAWITRDLIKALQVPERQWGGIARVKDLSKPYYLVIKALENIDQEDLIESAREQANRLRAVGKNRVTRHAENTLNSWRKENISRSTNLHAGNSRPQRPIWQSAIVFGLELTILAAIVLSLQYYLGQISAAELLGDLTFGSLGNFIFWTLAGFIIIPLWRWKKWVPIALLALIIAGVIIYSSLI